MVTQPYVHSTTFERVPQSCGLAPMLSFLNLVATKYWSPIVLQEDYSFMAELLYPRILYSCFDPGVPARRGRIGFPFAGSQYKHTLALSSYGKSKSRKKKHFPVL
jgi:hypothetical protein